MRVQNCYAGPPLPRHVTALQGNTAPGTAEGTPSWGVLDTSCRRDRHQPPWAVRVVTEGLTGCRARVAYLESATTRRLDRLRNRGLPKGQFRLRKAGAKLAESRTACPEVICRTRHRATSLWECGLIPLQFRALRPAPCQSGQHKRHGRRYTAKQLEINVKVKGGDSVSIPGEPSTQESI